MADPLDQIALEGAALDAGQDPGLDAPAAIAPAGPNDADMARAWAALPETVGSMLVMALPEVAPAYSPAACLLWGEHMVPVAKKYGWNDEKKIPELALLMVSLPFVVSPIIAVKRRRDAAPAKANPDSLTEGKQAEKVPAGMGSVNAGVV